MDGVLREEVRVLDEVGADVGGVVDGLAVIVVTGVDCGTVRVGTAEVADGIVGFEGEAEGGDLGVAIGARSRR